MSTGILFNWNMVYFSIVIYIFHKTLESVEGAEVNEVLENHQILPVGNGIEVVFTPGHTAGHILFVS